MQNAYILKNASTTKMKILHVSNPRNFRHFPNALSFFSQTSEMWPNFSELREPDSLKHSYLGPKIQEAALSITQMFASQASRVTWKRFYTLVSLLETFGQKGIENAIQPVKWELWFSWIQKNHSVSALKSGIVIISSDVLFTRAGFSNGLMRMKGLRQGFQAGCDVEQAAHGLLQCILALSKSCPDCWSAPPLSQLMRDKRGFPVPASIAEFPGKVRKGWLFKVKLHP